MKATDGFGKVTQARRAGGNHDGGFTLMELMVAMLLTSILLAVTIAPLISVTNVTSGTQSASVATASARAAFQDMSAGVTSAQEICLPTQLTSTQTATPGTAVRVRTHVFGSDEWEQWWVDPSTNRLLAQSWPTTTTGAPSAAAWRTVANNVSALSPQNPFTLTPTSGGISTIGTLGVGTYTATGTTSDGNSDSGTWTYSLHVYTPTPGTIAQVEPSSGTTTAGGSFTDHLLVTGSSGTVTYTTTVGGSFTVSAAGTVSVPSGGLSAGTYTVSGTDTDSSSGTGTWAYTLHVYTPTTGTIVQTTPTTGTVTTTGATGFADELAVTGNVGTVTYAKTGGSSSLTISSLPALSSPVVLSITIAASSGIKSTAVLVPIRTSITSLNTLYTPGLGTCMAGLG